MAWPEPSPFSQEAMTGRLAAEHAAGELAVSKTFIKAISLDQPWASLVLLSSDVRSHQLKHGKWDRDHGGLLLIHSAMRLPPLAIEVAKDEPLRTFLQDDPYWSILRGRVLGAVEIKSSASGMVREFPNAVRFKTPIPWKGRRKGFEVPARSVLLATEEWDECPEWWPEASGCPGCLCETCRSKETDPPGPAASAGFSR